MGDKLAKLNEKKSDRELERETKNKGDEFRWKNNMNILKWRSRRRRLLALQSTPAKTDTFGTGTGTGSKCPSQRDVRLIENQIKGVKKGWDQL